MLRNNKKSRRKERRVTAPGPRKVLFSLQAEVCKIMASPKRLEIIEALCSGEKTVNQLVEALGYPKANISQHLALFREKALVYTRRDGVSIHYRLANPKIARACGLMREVLLEQFQREQELLK